MALLGPKMAEHGRLADVPKRSKRAQNDPKWSIWHVFDHLGPFWDHLDPFWSFHTKLDFLPWKHKVLLGQSDLEQKLKFCVKWPKRLQMGPKWPQMVKTCYIDHLGSFWALLDHFGALASLPCSAIFGPKRAISDPSAHMIEGWQWPKLLQTNLVYV